jgi:hypothetical protein
MKRLEMIKEDVDLAMESAYKNGVGSDGSIASAYFLEAIAKMLYVQTFHTQYEVESEYEIEEPKDEDTKSIDI